MSKKNRLKARRRLFAIYKELGHNPWKKPKKVEVAKVEKAPKEGEVYMGAKETIPFMNDNAKRTFSHLLQRPGKMMRDYIILGKHEHYLAPLTAMLVFYSVFNILLAIVQPIANGETNQKGFATGFQEATLNIEGDDSSRVQAVLETFLKTIQQAVQITHLDQKPDAVDTPWKKSLAAVEGVIRSKGIPLFLGNFLLLWIAMSILLRKYNISVSGAAAASAYVMCQFCIFMLLALLLSFGHSTELGLLLVGIVLFVDYKQMFGLSNKQSLKLTVKTGLYYILFTLAYYLLIGVVLFLFSLAVN